MTLDDRIKKLAQEVVTLFIEEKLTLSTAESCTGGAVAAAVTSVPGSSQMFKGAVVAYSNEIKSKVLNVDSILLDRFGAVSTETVVAMSSGIRDLMQTDVGLSTSGIAGPTGATEGKPVGLVHFSVSDQQGSLVTHQIFKGDRENVQKKSVLLILSLLLNLFSLKRTLKL